MQALILSIMLVLPLGAFMADLGPEASDLSQQEVRLEDAS